MASTKAILEMDLYALLGIESTATAKQVRQSESCIQKLFTWVFLSIKQRLIIMYESIHNNNEITV